MYLLLKYAITVVNCTVTAITILVIHFCFVNYSHYCDQPAPSIVDIQEEQYYNNRAKINADHKTWFTNMVLLSVLSMIDVANWQQALSQN